MYNSYKSFVLKGNIVYSKSQNEISSFHQGFLVCEDGICLGAFGTLPDKFTKLPLIDCGNCLIIPGMTDIHAHAPQYTFRGIGMDLELLEWLNIHTFPEEAKYADIEYAKKGYSYFVEDLRRCFTTRAVIFATIHNDATIELCDQLEKSGIISYVGKVNMDRNSCKTLQEENAEVSLRQTMNWLNTMNGRYKNTFPIITPRFVPSCSDELMKGLGKISKQNGLRVQSHLSENKAEIAWVKELVPSSSCYANAYEMFDLMGDCEHPAIMAHCVYSDEKEMEILKKHGTFIAHCPESNMNLSSGIAPVRRFIEAGINVGIGTDVSAGSSLNMVKAMLCALQSSKMYYRLADTNAKALTFEEVFYLATMGGGKYFGKAGSFLEGYDFDAVVIDDSKMRSMKVLSARERVERMVYNDSDCLILEKYVKGRQVYCKEK